MSGSWLELSEELSDHLAQLLAQPEPTHADDLDLALHARSAVLELATAVHHDVTGQHRVWRRRVLESSLYVHPVEYLGRLLDEQSRPETRRSLVEVMGDQPRDRVGGGWRDAARSAALARHEWGRLEAGDRRVGPSAWTAMHQLAQHTMAVGWLDDALERDCRQAGRRDEAVVLRDSASRLRPAAASVMHLAASGPLEQLPDLRAVPDRRALALRGVEHLPRGVKRLSELVRTSEHVSPLQVQAGFRVLGRVVQRAVGLWDAHAPLRPSVRGRAPGEPAGVSVAQAMVEHAQALRRSARDPGRARSLMPEDALVSAQIDQLALAVAAPEPHLWRGRPGAVVEFAGQVAASAAQATFVLGETVTSSLSEGQWLVPAGDREPLRMSWVFSTPRHALLAGHEAPTLLRSADQACAGADEVVTELSAVAWSTPPPPAQRATSLVVMRGGDLLAAALRDAERRAMPTPPRPSAPHQPPSR